MRATVILGISMSALVAACAGSNNERESGGGAGGTVSGFAGAPVVDTSVAGGVPSSGGITSLTSTGGNTASGGVGGTGGGVSAPINGGSGGVGPAIDAGLVAVDAGVDTPQGDSASPDSSPHGGASLWIPFNNPSTNGTYTFDRCTWFTDKDGACVLLKNKRSTAGTKTSDVYQTTNGGLTFTLLATIDGGNSAIDGDMDVTVLSPNEIWYTTAFVGMGYSGTIGRSVDGGKTFQSLTDVVHRALADPDVTTVPSFPLWRLTKVNGRIWVGSYSNYLASSTTDGASWQRIALPVDATLASAPELIATRTDLVLRYLRNFMIELYRWNGTSFAKVEATFPAPSDTDHGDTWWRASPFGDGLVFVDQRPWSWWGWPFAVSATVDGGRSFQTVMTGQDRATSDVLGLRDALVVNASQAYVCGVFAGTDQKQYSQIRKSSDGGKTWTVVHSEPADNSYTSVVLDVTGRAHAMRHVTDAYANEYSYTGHYVPTW